MEKVIGFSQCTSEEPWRVNQNNEMQAAARRHPELKLEIAHGENQNDKQIADVGALVMKGVNVLIVSPREAGPLTGPVDKAFDLGIPVIVLDRKVRGKKFTSFIGASNWDIGRAAGQYLAETLKPPAKIWEIEGVLGATATKDRHGGFREALAEHQGLEVVYEQIGDFLRLPAKQKMENALRAFPKIDAVFAHNDEMAIGAFLAAKALGREKQMVIVGIDGQGEAVKMVRAGELAATFIYPNGASEAIETSVKILKGETVPKEITLETTRITRDEHMEYKGF
ncbi:MAG TPA: substrate-binding domain-containing protein [bacterium]|nr:substrate-binding domain-containing protein [bacterium]